MSDTKTYEIEWEGEMLEIYLSLDVARLPQESFKQYQVRRKLIQVVEKQRSKGIPIPPGTPTRSRQKQMLKRSLRQAMEADKRK